MGDAVHHIPSSGCHQGVTNTWLATLGFQLLPLSRWLQAFLQEFSWTQAAVPRDLARRNALLAAREAATVAGEQVGCCCCLLLACMAWLGPQASIRCDCWSFGR